MSEVETQSVQVDPLASAAHYKKAADFWENQAHLLQNAVLVQKREIAGLKEKLEHRDAEIARLDKDRAPTDGAGASPARPKGGKSN
jgi:hypothetical protein